jgi:hypothetical protein
METKYCPYCGEEILAIAKKCKHCGEWLNTENSVTQNKILVCPYCAEEIEEGLEICPLCDEPLRQNDEVHISQAKNHIKEKPKKKSKVKRIWAIVTIIFAIGIYILSKTDILDNMLEKPIDMLVDIIFASSDDSGEELDIVELELELEDKYDWVGVFSEGLVPVRLNGKYGFVNKTGKEIVPLKYDFARDFNQDLQGLAIVKLNDKCHYIDKKGNRWKYDEAYGFEEDLAPVMLNGKWGYIDRNKKEVIPLKYDFAGSFNLELQGLALVKLNDKLFYIDKTGKFVKDHDNPVYEDDDSDNDNDDDNLVTGPYERFIHISERLLTEDDIKGFSKPELRILRNEIYARHGYIFKSKDLQDYFSAKDWYSPKYEDVASLLNTIEKQNVEFIKKHE